LHFLEHGKNETFPHSTTFTGTYEIKLLSCDLVRVFWLDTSWSFWTQCWTRKYSMSGPAEAKSRGERGVSRDDGEPSIHTCSHGVTLSVANHICITQPQAVTWPVEGVEQVSEITRQSRVLSSERCKHLLK
jgi:hypothetical protein